MEDFQEGALTETNHSLEKKRLANTPGESIVKASRKRGTTIHPKELQVADLVNLDQLQSLLKNFCDTLGIASAIIDLNGNVLAAARWQRSCTDFHRVCEISCQRCIESDTELAIKLKEGLCLYYDRKFA